jgi:hypothetical protein
MPDRPARLFPGVALLVLLVGALLAPGVALGVSLPGESWPDATLGPNSSQVACGEGRGPQGNAGGGPLNLGAIVPIVAVVGGGLAIALVAALLLLRRQAGAPVAPADPTEWWTCSNCGRNNVIGSPRCYACGTWQA